MRWKTFVVSFFRLLKLAEDEEIGEKLDTRSQGVNSKSSSLLSAKCPYNKITKCNKWDKFRKIDGSCNNLVEFSNHFLFDNWYL